jgi:small subunit ribosomal protein S18
MSDRRRRPPVGARHIKPGVVVRERVEYVDYKDVALLERCVSERSKIRARRVTGHGSGAQRDVERAVKNAREMALLPYVQRVTSGAGQKRRSRHKIEETE